VIVPYAGLPGEADGQPRPVVDVIVADLEDVLVPCLVDSGALHSLLPLWVAEAGGIELEREKPKKLAVAARKTKATFVTTRLTAAGHTWDADVGFCDPWPYSWGLLGQLSFFRFFTVIFRAADFELQLDPIDI
jgi:hypothetical protein